MVAPVLKNHGCCSITTELGDDVVNVLPHDAYYRSKPHLDFEERSNSNFDHPDSVETNLCRNIWSN